MSYEAVNEKEPNFFFRRKVEDKLSSMGIPTADGNMHQYINNMLTKKSYNYYDEINRKYHLHINGQHTTLTVYENIVEKPEKYASVTHCYVDTEFDI